MCICALFVRVPIIHPCSGIAITVYPPGSSSGTPAVAVCPGQTQRVSGSLPDARMFMVTAPTGHTLTALTGSDPAESNSW